MPGSKAQKEKNIKARAAREQRKKDARVEADKMAKRDKDKVNISRKEIAEIRERFKRPRGQFITREETNCILACYFSYLDENPFHSWAVRQTAAHLPFPRKSIASAVSSWNECGEVRVARRHGPTGGGLTPDVKEYLANCVEKLHREGNVTLPKLVAMLGTPQGANGGEGGGAEDGPDHGRKPITVCCSTVRNWLKIMGYSRVERGKGFTYVVEEATL